MSTIFIMFLFAYYANKKKLHNFLFFGVTFNVGDDVSPKLLTSKINRFFYSFFAHWHSKKTLSTDYVRMQSSSRVCPLETNRTQKLDYFSCVAFSIPPFFAIIFSSFYLYVCIFCRKKTCLFCKIYGYTIIWLI